MARRLETFPLTDEPQDFRHDVPSSGTVRIHNVSPNNRAIRVALNNQLTMPGAYTANTSAAQVGRIDTITTTGDTSKDFWIREEDVYMARRMLRPGRSFRVYTSAANGALFNVTAVNEDDQNGGVEFECTIGGITIEGNGVANNQNITIFKCFIDADDPEGFTIPPGSYSDITLGSEGLMIWAAQGDGYVQIGYDG